MLTDDRILRSIARHLGPTLFECGTASAGGALRNRRAIHALMAAQIELNEFVSRSADAVSRDDGMGARRSSAQDQGSPARQLLRPSLLHHRRNAPENRLQLAGSIQPPPSTL